MLKNKKAYPLLISSIWCVAIAIILLAIGDSFDLAHAQATAVWSEPVNLSSAFDDGTGETLAIAAGRDGTVHVVWNSGPNTRLNPAQRDEPKLLYYIAWDGFAWSKPIDIVLTRGPASYPRIVLDSLGIIHLIYQGENCLSYTSVSNNYAQAVQKWRKEMCLAGSTVSQDFLIDSSDNLHLVYGTSDNALQYQFSSDYGQTWSSPMTINYGSGDRFLHMPAIAVDGQNGLHVIWAEHQLPEGYPPLGISYSASFDNGRSWSAPTVLQGGFAAEPTLIADGETLHAVWGSALAWEKRFYRHSSDRGASWGDLTELVSGGGGLLWQPTLVTDQTGAVHVVTNQDTGALYMHNSSGIWSEPEKIYEGPMAHARMVMGPNNEIHLVFRDQRDASIQYMRLVLPLAPDLAQPYPTPSPIPTSTSLITTQDDEQPDSEPVLFDRDSFSINEYASGRPAFISLLFSSSLSLALVMLVVALKARKR